MSKEEIYVEHTVVDMDESMIQNCVICGEEIFNYQNAMYPSGSPPPKGFAAGQIYISSYKNPQIFLSTKPIAHTVISCNG